MNHFKRSLGIQRRQWGRRIRPDTACLHVWILQSIEANWHPRSASQNIRVNVHIGAQRKNDAEKSNLDQWVNLWVSGGNRKWCNRNYGRRKKEWRDLEMTLLFSLRHAVVPDAVSSSETAGLAPSELRSERPICIQEW